MENTVVVFDGANCHSIEDLKRKLSKALGFPEIVIVNGSHLRDLIQFDDLRVLLWKNYDANIEKFGMVVKDIITILKEIETKNTGFHLFLEKYDSATDIGIIERHTIDCSNIARQLDLQNEIKSILSINTLSELSCEDMANYLGCFTECYLIIECINVDLLEKSMLDYLKYLEISDCSFANVRFDLIDSNGALY